MSGESDEDISFSNLQSPNQSGGDRVRELKPGHYVLRHG